MSFAHAYGAFLGAMCGDAAGATLEFFHGTITSELVQKAMRMPGGGMLDAGPGQITDDSELALALARGLRGHARSDGFPWLSVARQYLEWQRSNPFDIGTTCRAAFTVAKNDDSLATTMITGSAKYNAPSEANGSLMRIVPLAIWASREPVDQVAALARQEATLSHPNVVCQDCNAIYCLIITHLIQHPGDQEGALHKAKDYVNNHVPSKVREWFTTESLDISKLDCSRMIGHVRWAFTLAIHYLRQNTPYETAIHDTLLKGGDTDTNAAIVGGLLGALHGVDSIPAYMRTAVLSFDCTACNPGEGRRRPGAYKASQVEELTRVLLG